MGRGIPRTTRSTDYLLTLEWAKSQTIRTEHGPNIEQRQKTSIDDRYERDLWED